VRAGRYLFALTICLVANQVSFAQSYSFAQRDPDFHYLIRYDSGLGISCLFRQKLTDKTTTYRKVFLNNDLQPVDSIDLNFPGTARLVSSYSNKQFSLLAFQSDYREQSVIHLIVLSGRTGKIKSWKEKKLTDFDPYFPRKLNEWNALTFRFLENPSAVDTLLLVPIARRHYETMVGKLFAFDVEKNEPLWSIEGRPVGRMLASAHYLIGLDRKSSAFRIPGYTLSFYNKRDGHLVHSENFNAGHGFRKIDFFVCREDRLLVGGKQFQRNNSAIKKDIYEQLRQYHYFITLYKLSGEKVLDVVDSIRTYSYMSGDSQYLLVPPLTKEQAGDSLITNAINYTLFAEQQLDAGMLDNLYGMNEYVGNFVPNWGPELPGKGPFADDFYNMEYRRREKSALGNLRTLFKTPRGGLAIQNNLAEVELYWMKE
jgi:hypothetical protein